MKNNINTELTPAEASKVLAYMVNQNVELAKNGHMPVAINIEGAPGIAKTSIVKQLALESNTHYYIRLNVSELDPGDWTI